MDFMELERQRGITIQVYLEITLEDGFTLSGGLMGGFTLRGGLMGGFALRGGFTLRGGLMGGFTLRGGLMGGFALRGGVMLRVQLTLNPLPAVGCHLHYMERHSCEHH